MDFFLLKRSFIIALLFFFSSSIYSSINDYIYPKSNYPSYSNYGTTGLIQLPTARMMPAGSLALSWSDIDPYLRGSIIAYPFSWLEASYQYTDINNALYSDVTSFSGNQTYKDKSFDFKIKLINEGVYLPDISVGGRDLAGTGIFSSEYLVGTKRFSNLDFTLGIGWGMLSEDKLSNPFEVLSDRFKSREYETDTLGGDFNVDSFFSGPASLFGGIEYFVPNSRGMRIKLEYDATDYDLEGFPDGNKSFKFAFKPVKRPDSRVNVGIVYPVSNNLHFKLSYVKGNTLSFGFSFQAALGGKHAFTKKNDPPKQIENANIIKKVNEKKDEFVYLTSLKYLAEEKLYLQHADISNDELHVVYTQSHHQSHARSSGRALRVLDQIAPDSIKSLRASNINGGMGMYSISMPRSEYQKNEKNNLHVLAKESVELTSFEYKQKDYSFNPEVGFPATFWRVTPSLKSQIGGPDGFYFGGLGIAFQSETLFRRNISWLNSVTHGIYDNFDDLKLESDSIIPHVRTDIVKYLKQSTGLAITRSQLNYFSKISDQTYIKFSGGIFEPMFSGFGGEILYRPFNGNYGIGAEVWRAYQRQYNQLFGIRDYRINTGHINFYYKEPRSEVIIALKGGRFLAGDSGVNFDFSRRFKSGLRIGAFFSLTDISKTEFGEGSFDKGFYFYVPIELFSTKYSKRNTGFGLRPITRDGAQYLIHGLNLWGVTEQAQSVNISRDFDDFYD